MFADSNYRRRNHRGASYTHLILLRRQRGEVYIAMISRAIGTRARPRRSGNQEHFDEAAKTLRCESKGHSIFAEVKSDLLGHPTQISIGNTSGEERAIGCRPLPVSASFRGYFVALTEKILINLYP